MKAIFSLSLKNKLDEKKHVEKVFFKKRRVHNVPSTVKVGSLLLYNPRVKGVSSVNGRTLVSIFSDEVNQVREQCRVIVDLIPAELLHTDRRTLYSNMCHLMFTIGNVNLPKQ
jgi:hypothetical protein